MSDEPLIMVVREIVGFTDDSTDEWMETVERVARRWERVKRRWESKHPIVCSKCRKAIEDPTVTPRVVVFEQGGYWRDYMHRECITILARINNE